MNYFPFDPCPRASAICLDDKRLPRVFGEAVMVLSKAQYRLTGENGPYSPRTPVPGALFAWVIGEGEQWFVAWASHLLHALVERNGEARVNGYACYQRYVELQRRFRVGHIDFRPPSFPNLARAAVKGLDYSHMDDTHAAYREYLRAQWNGIDKRPNVWTHHGPPVWADDGIEYELRLLGL